MEKQYIYYICFTFVLDLFYRKTDIKRQQYGHKTYLYNIVLYSFYIRFIYVLYTFYYKAGVNKI